MSDVNGATAPAEQAPPAIVRTAGGDGPLDARAAARSLIDTRRKDAATVSQSERAEPAAPAVTESEATQAAEEVSPQPEVPDQTTEADQAETPPIEPPRSWTKEDKAVFAGLPRETQERLVDRERSREKDFLQRQNEAATKLKDLSAKELAAEQARQTYETALPQLLQNLVSSAEWGDIRTQADVDQLARDNPSRWVLWQQHLEKARSVANELQTSQQRQQADNASKFDAYGKRQDELFTEKVPAMADPKQADALRMRAGEVLKEVGFADDELSDLWHGKRAMSLRDARLQEIVYDAIRYRDAQAKARKATVKPIPPVQRPGVTPPKGAPDAQVQVLTQKLDGASGRNALLTAAKLVATRRAAAR